MRSISNGLGQWVKKGLLEIHAAPPALQGPKHHLVMMHNKVWALRPSVIAVEQMTTMTKRQALLCQYEKYFRFALILKRASRYQKNVEERTAPISRLLIFQPGSTRQNCIKSRHV